MNRAALSQGIWRTPRTWLANQSTPTARNTDSNTAVFQVNVSVNVTCYIHTAAVQMLMSMYDKLYSKSSPKSSTSVKYAEEKCFKYTLNIIRQFRMCHAVDLNSAGRYIVCFCQPTVAPEAVWQIWRPPYQSEIWYGGAIPICFGQLIFRKIIKIVATRLQI